MPTKLVDFLIDFKRIMTNGAGLNIIPRSKNYKTFLELGLNLENIREIILALSLVDYVKGPERDKDKPGEIWVFGKQVMQVEVYIKLKIALIGKEKIAKCISFHVAEFPIHYPNKRR